VQSGTFFGPAPKTTGKPAPSEVVAVHRRTGEVAWRTPLPKAFNMADHPTALACDGAVVIAAGGKVTAFDPATGKAKWWADRPGMVTTATPVAAGGRLYVNCTGLGGDTDRAEAVPFEQALKQWDKNADGRLQRDEIPDDLAVFTRRRDDHEGDFALKQWYFQRADADRDGALDAKEWGQVWGPMADQWVARMKPALYALRLGGEGDVAASHAAWQVHRGVPEVPTLLVLGKRVYAVRNGGVVTCFDAETGKPHFEQRLGASGTYYASPVTDGDRVYFVSQPGVVTVLKAAETFERLAVNDLKEDVSATPAVVEGQLIVRTAGHLYAFGGSR
jgi:outer membrane protein assembly factor BamB